ncbi:hypothetical protein CTI12_AA149570 [Artemisia annua]|uniref:Uncharacterized protein n=1 Tax=Artemisia annua TaxID=35608 RepID=A0A2U1PI04_ARTAN|nr:hypothetical protein CTI12_AA149570 [Artemisia annua]
MSSGNGPPSFSNGTNISSYVDSTNDAQVNNKQPPSYSNAMGHGGNSLNQFQNESAYRELGQTDTSKPPTFTALERERNSHAHGGNLKHELGNVGGQGPSLGSAVARGNYSDPSGGVEHYDGAQAPNLSDANRRDASHTGDSSMVIEGSDAQEYVGMSLVGKNFRRFYPNAYYKGKDSDN